MKMVRRDFVAMLLSSIAWKDTARSGFERENALSANKALLPQRTGAKLCALDT
jgi:hypothetical protein